MAVRFMLTSMELSDQVAVITGAKGGIGRAIAAELAGLGTKLALTDRNPKALHALVRSLSTTSGFVRCYAADLTNNKQIKFLVGNILKDFGRVDILVHSIGSIVVGRMDQAHLEDFDYQYAVNVRAPYSLTQALLPGLKEQKGQIVFINSTAGLHASPDSAQYAACKHALKAIADSLREEVNVNGVRVLNVFPGRTATPMQASLYKKHGWNYRPELLMQPEDVARMIVSALSLPRTAEVTEIRMRPLLKSY